MINYDSILSAFDGKPTLLQWLKMVKKALDESVLKNVTIAQNGEKVVFSFNFEDGTSISTPEVTLPKGDKGDKGDNGVSVVNFTFDSYQVLANNTETTYKMTLSNGTETNFVIFAKNGKDGSNGTDGVSITGINTVGNEVVGDETLTTLRANYSNATSDEFVVKAKNGGNIYLHSVKISNVTNNSNIIFNIYSTKEEIDLNEAMAAIPIIDKNNSFEGNKIQVSYYNISENKFGVVSAGKYEEYGSHYIDVSGVVVSNGNAETLSGVFIPALITDTLLGVNL